MPAHVLFSIYYMALRPDLFVLLLMENKNTKVTTVSVEMSV